MHTYVVVGMGVVLVDVEMDAIFFIGLSSVFLFFSILLFIICIFFNLFVFVFIYFIKIY